MHRIPGALDLRELAHALGGVVAGSQVLAPGPGHGPRDRSLSIRISAIDPDGFVTNSFASDDWRDCRAHVLTRLGLTSEHDRRRDLQAPKPRPAPAKAATTTEQALTLWHEAVDPRRTLVERYLNGRELDLSDDLAGEVLRWHPRIGAMVALFHGIQDGQPQAITRTFIDREARKIERKFLGPVTGAAIMLDPFDEVLGGLHIGEGIETCIASRQVEHRRPCWALGSSGGIAAFPVLGGIECLTILTENDESGANARAVETCAARWYAAGREVLLNDPIGGKDLNDAVRMRSARHE